MDDDGGYGKASRTRRHRAGLGVTSTPYARPGPAAPQGAPVTGPVPGQESVLGSVLKAPLRAAGYMLTKVPLLGGWFGEEGSQSPAAVTPREQAGGLANGLESSPEGGEELSLAALPEDPLKRSGHVTPSRPSSREAGFISGTPPAAKAISGDEDDATLPSTPFDGVLAMLRAGPLSSSAAPSPGSAARRRPFLHPLASPAPGSLPRPRAGQNAAPSRFAPAAPSPLVFRPPVAASPAPFGSARRSLPAAARPRGDTSEATPRLAWTPSQRAGSATPTGKRKAEEPIEPSSVANNSGDAVSILDLQRRTRARSCLAGRTPYRSTLGTSRLARSGSEDLFPLLGGPASPWAFTTNTTGTNASPTITTPGAATSPAVAALRGGASETARRILATLDAMDATLLSASKGAAADAKTDAVTGEKLPFPAPPALSLSDADGAPPKEPAQQSVAFGGVSFQPGVLAKPKSRDPRTRVGVNGSLKPALKPNKAPVAITGTESSFKEMEKEQEEERSTPSNVTIASTIAPVSTAPAPLNEQRYEFGKKRDKALDAKIAVAVAQTEPTVIATVTCPVFEFGKGSAANKMAEIKKAAAQKKMKAAEALRKQEKNATPATTTPTLPASGIFPAPLPLGSPLPRKTSKKSVAAVVEEAAKSPLPPSDDETEPEKEKETVSTGGWDASFLKANAAAANAATEAAKKAIEEQSKPAGGLFGASPAPPFTFGTPGTETAPVFSFAAAAGAPPPVFGAQPSEEPKSAAAEEPTAGKKEEQKVPEATTTTTNGWGDAVLKANKAANDVAAAAVQKEIDDAKKGPSAPSSAPAFIFATGPAPSSSSAGAPAGFSFGSTAGGETSTPAPAFSFGAATSSAGPGTATKAPLFGQPSDAAAPPPSFPKPAITQQEAPPAALPGFGAFGAEASEAPVPEKKENGFVFGNAAAPFGALASADAPKNAQPFAAFNASSAPLPSSTAASSPALGAKSDAAPSFGAAHIGPVAAAPANAFGAAPAFGSTASGASSSAAFGAAAAPGTTFGFGAAASSPSLFPPAAADSSPAPAPTSAPAFGAPATTAGFGFGSGASTTSAAEPFSFGASQAASSSASAPGFSFGAPASSSAAGTPAPTFSFGGTSAPATGGFTFGAAPSTPALGFGAATTTQGNPAAPAGGFAFGQQQQQQQAPAFGGAAPGPQPQQQGPVFGAAAPTPQQQPAGFAFGQQQQPPAFGMSQPAPAFGGFGQQQQQQQPQQGGGFAFGAGQPAPAFGAAPQQPAAFGGFGQPQPGADGSAPFGGGMPGAFSLGSNSQSESARRKVKVKRAVRR